MNLHAIAGPIVAAVNPTVPVTIQFSQGSTIGADGIPVPAYSAPTPMQAQIQALTFGDLRQVDALNLDGTRRAMYLYGDVQAIVRVTQQGGDLITVTPAFGAFAAGSVWLVAMTLETWANDGWCKVACTLQNGG